MAGIIAAIPAVSRNPRQLAGAAQSSPRSEAASSDSLPMPEQEDVIHPGGAQRDVLAHEACDRLAVNGMRYLFRQQVAAPFRPFRAQLQATPNRRVNSRRISAALPASFRVAISAHYCLRAIYSP
jgi:hypothetical protein